MFEIDSEMAAKLRERRARKRKTIQEASEEMGISRITLGNIEREKIVRVSRKVYEKIVNWLIIDREVS